MSEEEQPLAWLEARTLDGALDENSVLVTLAD
jgi:hypothetical protein